MDHILNIKDIEDVRRSLKGEEKENGAEDKMLENFSKLMKDINPQSKELYKLHRQ